MFLALNMAATRVQLLLSSAALFTACSRKTNTSINLTPVERVETSHGDSSGEVPIDGPLDEPCALGQMSSDARRVQFSHLMANPDRYHGPPIILRGYFILRIENVSLLEPTRRKDSVLVDVQKLPAENAQELLACRLKLVDVQGYLTHVPNRGREDLMIVAQAIVSPQKVVEQCADSGTTCH